ncbi:MAG: magnesium/cobalt transporter CorA [Myxococcota bacterium]
MSTRIFACRVPKKPAKSVSRTEVEEAAEIVDEALMAPAPGQVFEPGRGQLPELLADPEMVVWASLEEHGAAEQRLLTEVFQIHPLLVEDALSSGPTPKAEAHDDYLYLILHGLAGTSDADEVHTTDVDFFIGKNFLITHHDKAMPSLDRVRREVASGKWLRKGPMFVAHRLTDLMVDRFLPLIEKLDKDVVAVEEQAMASGGPELLQRIFQLKHTLQGLRRVGVHQREILQRLARGEYPFVPKKARPFWQDVLDHWVRVQDMADTYRDLVSSSLDAYLSMQSHRLNEVMRTLTVISTIMLPLTFITGLYGMNFDYMPGIHWKYGYETAWIVMIAVAVGFWGYSKRRRWI